MSQHNWGLEAVISKSHIGLTEGQRVKICNMDRERKFFTIKPQHGRELTTYGTGLKDFTATIVPDIEVMRGETITFGSKETAEAIAAELSTQETPGLKLGWL